MKRETLAPRVRPLHAFLVLAIGSLIATRIGLVIADEVDASPDAAAAARPISDQEGLDP